MSKTYTFYIDGMTCGSCRGFIEHALKNDYPLQFQAIKVHDLTLDIQPKKTEIDLLDDTLSWQDIKKTIEDTGFGCSEPLQTIEESLPEAQIAVPNKGNFYDYTHWLLGALGTITGFTALIVAMFFSTMPAVMIPLGVISVILTLFLGRKSYFEAAKKLSHGLLTMDTLLSLSTLTVLGVSIAAFFVPWLPMMFEMGLLIFGFRHIGLAIEGAMKEKLIPTKFQDKAPKKVTRILNNGQEEDIALEAIFPGDCIRIKPGEIIPLDGYCENVCYINTHDLDGQNNVERYSNEKLVFAGVILESLEGAKDDLIFRVQAGKNDSYLARLDSAVKKYDHAKSALEEKTDLILRYFIPSVIAISIISGLVIGSLFTPALALTCAISVLVSACPCILGLIIPMSVQTGVHKAAEYGVRFKSAKVLQEASDIDVVVFDLNGTLTTGTKTVASLHETTEQQYSEESLLNLAYTLESHAYEYALLNNKSPHAITKTIRAFTEKKEAQRRPLEDLDLSNHAGVSGLIDNVRYSIGSPSLLLKAGVCQQRLEACEKTLALGDSLVGIARENQLIGYFVITDPLRKDALETIRALKAMGKRVQLCTGAHELTAQRYAKALDITEVYAGQAPTGGDKAKDAHIDSMKAQGLKVAMIGDGLNDIAAVSASDFSIAMASDGCNEDTLNLAGAIINNGTLMPIANAFAVSQQTVSNINQNLLMSLFYNLATVLIAGGLLVAIGFTLNPVIGVVLMFAQFCLVFLNVYRFKHQSLPHLTSDENHIDDTMALTKNQPHPFSKLLCKTNSLDNEILPQDSPNEHYENLLSDNNHQKTLLTPSDSTVITRNTTLEV